MNSGFIQILSLVLDFINSRRSWQF